MEKKTEVAIGILCDEHGRLLVGRRMRSPQLGKWEMPGGKVEPGETVPEALRREFFEEGGVILNEIAHWTKIIDDHYVLYLFKVSTHDIFIPTIYEEYRFVSADDLTTLDWIESNRSFVKDLRDILKSDPTTTMVSCHPQSQNELADCLDEFTQKRSSRNHFYHFICTLEADALLYQDVVGLSEKVAQMYHEGLSFCACGKRPDELPLFIQSQERG